MPDNNNATFADLSFLETPVHGVSTDTTMAENLPDQNGYDIHAPSLAPDNQQQQQQDNSFKSDADFENYLAKISAPVKNIRVQDVYTADEYQPNIVNPDNMFSSFLPEATGRYNTFGKGDLEQLNYEGQGALSTLGNALAGFGAIGLLAFQNHFAQYGRDIDAISNASLEKEWNSKGAFDTADASNSVRDMFAIYEPASSKNDNSFLGGLLQYVPFTEGSGAAFGNLAQNLGYTAGTIGAVALENAVGGVLTGGVGDLLASEKSAKSIYDSLAMTIKGLKGANNTIGELRAAKTMSNVFQTTAETAVGLARTFHTASAEASGEATNAVLEFRKDEVQKYKDANGGQEPPKEFLDELKKRESDVGNTTYKLNLPVLMASDMLQFGNMLFKGKFIVPHPLLENARVVDGAITTSRKGIWDKVAQYATWNSAKGVIGTVAEGNEEFLQKIASESAKRKYAMDNSSISKDFTDVIAETTKSELDKGEIWKEFWSGILTGGVTATGMGAINRLSGANKERQSKTDALLSEVNKATGKESILAMAADSGLKPTRSNLTNGVVQMNASVGAQKAKEEKDTNEVYNYKDEAKKEFLALGASTGKSNLMYESLAHNVKTITVDEWATERGLMENVDETNTLESVVDKDKNDFLKNLKEEQKKFNDVWVDINENFTADKKWKPEFKESFERAKRDMAYYYQDFSDATKRSEAMVNDMQGFVKQYFNGDIKKEDILLTQSRVATDARINSLQQQIDAKKNRVTELEKVAPELVDQTVKDQIETENAEIKSLQEHKQLLDDIKNSDVRVDKNNNKVKESTRLAATNRYLGYLSESSKNGDKFTDITTLDKYESDTDLAKMAKDYIKLEHEAGFYLNLFNTLRGDAGALMTYTNAYDKATEKKKNADKIGEATLSTGETVVAFTTDSEGNVTYKDEFLKGFEEPYLKWLATEEKDADELFKLVHGYLKSSSGVDYSEDAVTEFISQLNRKYNKEQNKVDNLDNEVATFATVVDDKLDTVLNNTNEEIIQGYKLVAKGNALFDVYSPTGSLLFSDVSKEDFLYVIADEVQNETPVVNDIEVKKADIERKKSLSQELISFVWDRLAKKGITNADSVVGTRDTIDGVDFNKFWSNVTKEDLQNLKKSYETQKQKELDLYNKFKGEFDPSTGTITSNDTSFFDNKIKNVDAELDGVYYQGKKLENPENKTHKQLIEADIERRRQELTTFNKDRKFIKGIAHEIQIAKKFGLEGFDVDVSNKANTSTGFLYSNVLSEHFDTLEEAIEYANQIIQGDKEYIKKVDAELAALEPTVTGINLISTPVADIISELNKLPSFQEKLDWLRDNNLLQPIMVNGKKYNAIDYSDRVMVLMKIGRYNLPFYISTGQAGKKNVKAGNWYVVFGIGEESGWINKGSEQDINNSYGYSPFQKISNILNEGIGTIIGRDDSGKIKEGIGFLSDEGTSLKDFNAQMNLPITPAGKHTDSDIFYSNIKEINRLLNIELSTLVPTQQETKVEAPVESDDVKAAKEAIRSEEGLSNFGVLLSIPYTDIDKNKFKPSEQLRFSQGTGYEAVILVGNEKLIRLIEIGAKQRKALTGTDQDRAKYAIVKSEQAELEKEIGITALDANTRAKELAKANRENYSEVIIVLGHAKNVVEQKNTISKEEQQLSELNTEVNELIQEAFENGVDLKELSRGLNKVFNANNSRYAGKDALKEKLDESSQANQGERNFYSILSKLDADELKTIRDSFLAMLPVYKRLEKALSKQNIKDADELQAFLDTLGNDKLKADFDKVVAQDLFGVYLEDKSALDYFDNLGFDPFTKTGSYKQQQSVIGQLTKRITALEKGQTEKVTGAVNTKAEKLFTEAGAFLDTAEFAKPISQVQAVAENNVGAVSIQETIDNAKYTPRHKNTEIVRLRIDDVLSAQDKNNGFDVERGKNEIGNRIDKAKKYLESNPSELEPSIAYISNGKVGFEDGRHRLIAAKELGAVYAYFEVQKDQIAEFKKLSTTAEQSPTQEASPEVTKENEAISKIEMAQAVLAEKPTLANLKKVQKAINSGLKDITSEAKKTDLANLLTEIQSKIDNFQKTIEENPKHPNDKPRISIPHFIEMPNTIVVLDNVYSTWAKGEFLNYNGRNLQYGQGLIISVSDGLNSLVQDGQSLQDSINELESLGVSIEIFNRGRFMLYTSDVNGKDTIAAALKLVFDADINMNDGFAPMNRNNTPIPVRENYGIDKVEANNLKEGDVLTVSLDMTNPFNKQLLANGITPESANDLKLYGVYLLKKKVGDKWVKVGMIKGVDMAEVPRDADGNIPLNENGEPKIGRQQPIYDFREKLWKTVQGIGNLNFTQANLATVKVKGSSQAQIVSPNGITVDEFLADFDGVLISDINDLNVVQKEPKEKGKSQVYTFINKDGKKIPFTLSSTMSGYGSYIISNDGKQIVAVQDGMVYANPQNAVTNRPYLDLDSHEVTTGELVQILNKDEELMAAVIGITETTATDEPNSVPGVDLETAQDVSDNLKEEGVQVELEQVAEAVEALGETNAVITEEVLTEEEKQQLQQDEDAILQAELEREATEAHALELANAITPLYFTSALPLNWNQIVGNVEQDTFAVLNKRHGFDFSKFRMKLANLELSDFKKYIRNFSLLAKGKIAVNDMLNFLNRIASKLRMGFVTKPNMIGSTQYKDKGLETVFNGYIAKPYNQIKLGVLRNTVDKVYVPLAGNRFISVNRESLYTKHVDFLSKKQKSQAQRYIKTLSTIYGEATIPQLQDIVYGSQYVNGDFKSIDAVIQQIQTTSVQANNLGADKNIVYLKNYDSDNTNIDNQTYYYAGDTLGGKKIYLSNRDNVDEIINFADISNGSIMISKSSEKALDKLLKSLQCG